MSQTVCPNCAKVLAEGVTTCDACGASIGSEPVAVASAAPAPIPAQQPQPAYVQPQQPTYGQPPVYGQPPYQQPAPPTYGQPGPYYPPQQGGYYPPQPMQYVVKPSRPGRGFGIASMVLGIIGMVYAVVILIEMIAFIDIGMHVKMANVGMIMATIVYAVFGILAVSFAIPARKRGYVCGVSSSGLALGIASLSLNLIAAIIGAIGL